jgi:hypothetical protein
VGLLSGSLAGACSCNEPRPDDGLEPNDDFEHATRLTPGMPIEGRANQDDPDVFAVEAGPDEVLLFVLEDRGYENCPTFLLHDPAGHELLGQDLASNCGVSLAETRLEPGVELRELDDGGYEIQAPAVAAGDYFLTITEDGEADNIAPFSWDYRVTVTVEPMG